MIEVKSQNLEQSGVRSKELGAKNSTLKPQIFKLTKLTVSRFSYIYGRILAPNPNDILDYIIRNYCSCDFLDLLFLL